MALAAPVIRPNVALGNGSVFEDRHASPVIDRLLQTIAFNFSVWTRRKNSTSDSDERQGLLAEKLMWPVGVLFSCEKQEVWG